MHAKYQLPICQEQTKSAMRFVKMLNPYAFVGSEIASEQQIVATIRELYGASRILLQRWEYTLLL